MPQNTAQCQHNDDGPTFMHMQVSKLLNKGLEWTWATAACCVLAHVFSPKAQPFSLNCMQGCPVPAQEPAA